MNSSHIILFVLSLVFTLNRSQHNDSNITNISISNQDIREFMDYFADSLARLYTENSKDSLDEIMSFFDEDDQEICIVADCYRKENGYNDVRDYLKDNLMGKYSKAEITFQARLRPLLASSSEQGYVVRVNVAQYVTEIIDNQKCESLYSTQSIFLLNTDDLNELYIIKWIEMSSSDSSTEQPHRNTHCESLSDQDGDQDDDGNHGCMAGEYCQVTDDKARQKILDSSMNALFVSELKEYGIELQHLNLMVKSIESQVVAHEGKNIRITFQDDKLGEIVLKYYVSNGDTIDKDSVYLWIETISD